MIGASVNAGAEIPGSLNWAYEDSLNRQTDNLFWLETRYKPNQRLNPADPQDRAMIPRWWAARARIAQSRSPKTLIRERAAMAVHDARQNDPSPVFVHAAGPGGSETRSFPSLDDKRKEDYVNARMRDSAYVAVFDVRRSVLPISEVYPQVEIEIDRPPETVSGAAPPIIYYEGLTLYPLTPRVIAEHPDLDPWNRDEILISQGRDAPGWIDFEGRRHPPKLIRQVCLPDDDFYYWDGPWGVLSGSRGIAVVRRGAVVETFTTLMS